MSILGNARARLRSTGYQFPDQDPYGHYGQPSATPTSVPNVTVPGMGGTIATVPVAPGQAVRGEVPLGTPGAVADSGTSTPTTQAPSGEPTALDNAVQSAIVEPATGIFNRVNADPRGRRAINAGIDAVTGLPFGIASTLVNPRVVPTSWGTDFNTGGGGLIGAGGELSRRNLERVYDDALAEHAPTGETNPDYLQEAFGGGTIPTHAPDATTNFYAPGDALGTTTPIATHEGIIPGTRVVSGNTDLLPPEVDANNDGTVSSIEVDNFADPTSEPRQAYEQRQSNIRAANQELREQQESGQSQTRGGSAVTDSSGNPVRDTSGTIVTSGATRNEPSGGGDSGGGGGGGTWCCTAAMKHGMPVSKVKALRKWHRQQSQLWQDGYDVWGYWVAEKMVKNSPFWASVTEAGHDVFVNRNWSWKGALAWAVIVPGSYVAGVVNAIQK